VNQALLFEPDQHVNAILFGEAFAHFLSMLIRPACKIAGDTDIKRTVALAMI
jgi:hypothetical protein